jgi:hypothetical protein
MNYALVKFEFHFPIGNWAVGKRREAIQLTSNESIYDYAFLRPRNREGYKFLQVSASHFASGARIGLKNFFELKFLLRIKYHCPCYMLYWLLSIPSARHIHGRWASGGGLIPRNFGPPTDDDPSVMILQHRLTLD